MFILKSGNTALPAPVSIKISDEIIWSSDTGRTLNGYMIGEAIAEKKNISLQWSFLEAAEVKLLKNCLIAGFFPLTFQDEGQTYTIQGYRGTMSKEALGELGDGKYWYRSVTTDIIQR